MRTPASLGKHPVHPMMVVLPLGLWVFSFLCDLIYVTGAGGPAWQTVALYSMGGGIVGALIAAIPGLIDLLSIKGRRAKKIGLWHMGLNVTAVLLYSANLLFRVNETVSYGDSVVLSAVLILALVVSGWLGAELVYVHRIGVSGPRLEDEGNGDREDKLAA